MSDELLNVDQVAELLQCTTMSIYRFSKNGTMPPPTKIGKLSRWKKSELDEWIAKGCPKVK